MLPIPFQTIDWSAVEKTESSGTSGASYSQTLMFHDLRVRLVEYSPGYMADQWCHKGHIIHCLEGEFVSEMEDGSSFVLKTGMSYIVSDEMSSHRSVSANGTKLLIIDGGFLKTEKN